jgi:catechol 2,3-dioxygenase-like lactoylglutathione lyase family enzyme
VTGFEGVYAKLPAQDVARAKAFYGEKLGLTPVREHHDHLTYEVGAARFVVFPSSGSPSGTHDQLGLVVADVHTTVADLRAKGVELERDGVVDFGGVKAAWFKDSEGNLISVAEFG